MKITMIGMPGSGKTSFVSALYEALYVNNLGGFRIISNRDSNKIALYHPIHTSVFENVSFSENGYQFPKSVQTTTSWEFDLLYGTDRITIIELVDYVGSVLQDARSEILLIEKEEFLSEVISSNVLMIFIDSIKLTYYEDIRRARRETGIDTITSLLIDYVRLYPNRQCICPIVLTKVDALGPEWKSNNYELLINRGREAFSELISVLTSNPSWVGGIVPVSAIGEGKASTTIVHPSTIQTTLTATSELQEFPEPINVGQTFLYCIAQTLKLMQKEAQNSIEQRQQEILFYLNKASIINDVWELVTGRRRSKELARLLLKQQQDDYALLQQFEPYVNRLTTFEVDKVRPIF